MEFIQSKRTHITSDNSTPRMMKHLLIALMPIILFAIFKNGFIPYFKGYGTFFDAIYPLIFILISVASSFVFEGLFAKLVLKEKSIKKYLLDSYALFPGLFLSLILPINTPILVLIIGSFFASIIGKMVFGGFGHNIFNPALIGRLFVITIYGAFIASSGGYLNKYEVDTISSPTPLTNKLEVSKIGTYDELVRPYGDLSNFAVGSIPGALGETSAVLCILGLVYLSIKKIVKWRISVFYIGSVFISTLIIGSINNVGIWYPLFEILSGGLFFGAVFMATDPVTSPVTKNGQILHGICLGILTVVLRFLTPAPEGVLTSILAMNMVVPIIDNISSRAKFNIKNFLISLVVTLVALIYLSCHISFKIKNEVSTPVNKKYEITKTREVGNTEIYTVTGKGYGGIITLDVSIVNKKVTKIEIISHNETYLDMIEGQGYFDKIINSQNDLENLDTVSGATISSKNIRNMVKYVLEELG